MRLRLGVCSLVALCALVLAATGQAAITPGKSSVAGGPAETQALTPPVTSGDRHATAAGWHDGVMAQEWTVDCVTGVAILGGSYVGWFGEVGVSPVVNQTYYIRVGWGITANPCTGGAYVHTEIQLPSFTSLAVTATNKVRCFYKSPSATNLTESPGGCPQAPTSVGLYGGLSFDPVGATAWPSAFGSIFEIWIPVKTTQPLSGSSLGGSSGCPSCLFAGTWMIDGWNSPWVFPVQGVLREAGREHRRLRRRRTSTIRRRRTTPANAAGDMVDGGLRLNTEATSGDMYMDIRAGTSGAVLRARSDASEPAGLVAHRPVVVRTHAGRDISVPGLLRPEQAARRPRSAASPDLQRPGGADTTAPNTSIVGKPKARTNRSRPRSRSRSNELGSTFLCKLDGGAFAPCTRAGLHEPRRRVAHTSRSTPATRRQRRPEPGELQLDDRPDQAEHSTIKPPGPRPRRPAAKFKFPSTEAGSTFKCKLDAKPWAACARLEDLQEPEEGPPHAEREGGRQGGEQGPIAGLQELAHHLDRRARRRPSGRCVESLPATDERERWRRRARRRTGTTSAASGWTPPAARPSRRGTRRTGDVLGVFPLSGTEDMERAVEAAKAAYVDWRLVPAPKRGELLFRVARTFEERKDELTEQMVREMGKVRAEAARRRPGSDRHDVLHGRRGPPHVRPHDAVGAPGQVHDVDADTRSASSARSPRGTSRSRSRAGRSRPRSSAGTRSSSSRPGTRRCSPSCSSRSSRRRDCRRASSTSSTATGRTVGEHLVEHPDVPLISFTGSREVGARVQTNAGPFLKNVHLELGGKNAVIVMDDADLDLAVDGILWSAFGTSGQRCTAALARDRDREGLRRARRRASPSAPRP